MQHKDLAGRQMSIAYERNLIQITVVAHLNLILKNHLLLHGQTAFPKVEIQGLHLSCNFNLILLLAIGSQIGLSIYIGLKVTFS